MYEELKQETGELKHRTTKTRLRKLDREFLVVYVEQHPDAYLAEMAAQHILIAVQWPFLYALRAMKTTRKKL